MTDKLTASALDKGASERGERLGRLRTVLRAQFGELAPGELADLLAMVAGELRGEAAQGGAEVVGGARTGPQRLTDAFTPQAVGVSDGQQYVQLVAADRLTAAILLHQVVEVGAVVLMMPEPPALNATLYVEIKLEQAQFSVRTPGRVVLTSAAGVAVEVARIDREDRAALVSILVDHRAEVEQARAQVVPASSTPEQGASGQTQVAPQSPALPDGAPQVMGQSGTTLSGPMPFARFGAPEQDADLSATGTEFSRHKRPSSSVTLGALNRLGAPQDFSARREVELIDPDVRVLTASGRVRSLRAAQQTQAQPGMPPIISADSTHAGADDTSTTFGPEAPWITPAAAPARVEPLTGERILDVLLQLSGSGFTGILQVERSGVERQVYFDGGLVVQMTRRPRASSEELGPMLHMADYIDQRQLAMAAAYADENQTIFERSLLELELLEQNQIRHAIAGRLAYLLRLLCQTASGSIAVFENHAMPAGYLPAPPLRVHVPVERIIYRRLFERLKTLDASARQQLVAEHLDAYPQVLAEGSERLARVVLSEEHLRLVERIMSERRRLREVFTESVLSPSETAAVIHSLHRMGVVRFDTSLHKTIVRERFRENVTVKYLSVHKASYFEVLNVHWSSYDAVVHKAYDDLKVQFDPTMVPESMESEVVTRVREIDERVETAYRALMTQELRQAYRKRIMPQYKLTHAIPLFLKQAELAERRGDWHEAGDSLQRVLEIDPENHEAALRLTRVTQRQLGELTADPGDSNF